jgi:hypothetical protein
VTTNRGLPDWGTMFSDTVVASAIVDPLMHNAIVFNTKGPSWRLREHDSPELATTNPTETTPANLTNACPVPSRQREFRRAQTTTTNQCPHSLPMSQTMPTRLALEAAMGPMLEQRSPLRFDRAARILSIADLEVRLARRTSNDRIIRHYLRLVQEARDLSPRSRFAIRTQDLEVLSSELVLTIPLLRSTLYQAMDHRIRGARSKHRRPLLPAIGFTAALEAAGAVKWIADRADTTGTPSASSQGAGAQSPPMFSLSSLGNGPRRWNPDRQRGPRTHGDHLPIARTTRRLDHRVQAGT